VAAHAQALALAYKGGETYKYTLHSTASETMGDWTRSGGMTVPLKFDLTAVETIVVKSVDASGTADLSIDLSNVVIKSVTGQMTNTTTGMPIPAIAMKVAPDGRILSVNGNSFGTNPFTLFTGGGGFISAVLPDRAVKPGDTWSKDFDQANPLGTGTIRVTTKSSYLRNESLGGVNAAVVKTTSSGSIDITIDLSRMIGNPSVSPATTIPPPGMFQSLSIKGTMTSDTTTWLDPAGHRVLKSHKTGTSNTTMSFAGASDHAIPGLTGPITIKGDETTDLSPA
jgi:hypothetical protein